MKSELITAIRMLEEEKGIDAEMLFESVELAMVSAYRKERDYCDAATVIARMDRETGKISLFLVKTVVEDVYDNLLRIIGENGVIVTFVYNKKGLVSKVNDYKNALNSNIYLENSKELSVPSFSGVNTKTLKYSDLFLY